MMLRFADAFFAVLDGLDGAVINAGHTMGTFLAPMGFFVCRRDQNNIASCLYRRMVLCFDFCIKVNRFILQLLPNIS